MWRRLLLGSTADVDVGVAEEAEDDVLFTAYICITIGLVIMAGLMSGLTLGLMSLDMVDLEVRRAAAPAGGGTWGGGRATACAAFYIVCHCTLAEVPWREERDRVRVARAGATVRVRCATRASGLGAAAVARPFRRPVHRCSSAAAPRRRRSTRP